MATYPTLPGVAQYSIIGEIDMMGSEHTCSCGDAYGSPEDAERALQECRDRLAGSNWRNIRLAEPRPVVDAAAMREIAARLSTETGHLVHYDHHSGLSVAIGCTVRTSIAPTADAVREAVAEQMASPWNQPDRSTNAIGGSCWEDEEDTLRRERQDA